jgi:twinkle protein
MAETLVELLAEHGIRPNRYTPGHSADLRCPRCDGGKTRETSLRLKINEDGNGALWKCFRASCGWQGGEKLRDRVVEQKRRDPPKPSYPRPREDEKQTKPQWLYEFFAGRGISEETVDAFGVYSAHRKFGGEIGEYPAIVFPYRLKGELVNRKYRPAPPHKRPQSQDINPLPTLYNVDAVESLDEIIWVEGEPDCMAVHEAGFPQVVSLKDGAPPPTQTNQQAEADKRYEALTTHSDLLRDVQRVILAGDMDAPGMALRDELARRLGRHRCWTVQWPPECKDACDTLQRLGKQGVVNAIANAQPYPVDGLQRIRIETLMELYQKPAPAILTTGSRATDVIMKFPGEGRMIILTGVPNSGKSQWLMFVSIHLMAEHNRRFVIFSPEMQPWEEYVAQCASVWCGKPFRRMRDVETMSEQEIIQASIWLGSRLIMMVSDAEKEVPDLDWVLDRAKVAVLQQGCTDLVIDPWNEIEQKREGSSETDYVGRALQRLRSFAQRHGCNVWIVAHPTKMQPAKPGEKLHAPGLYDIAGGANWANKADIGISVHRLNVETEIHLLKSRYQRWGQRGKKAILEFDPLTGRYFSPPTPVAGTKP